jgi:hypothetical protein
MLLSLLYVSFERQFMVSPPISEMQLTPREGSVLPAAALT